MLNDFVTFSGASTMGGTVTAVLNTEHQITRIVNNDVYEITLSANANSTDVSNSWWWFCYSTYQINTGLDTNFFGTVGCRCMEWAQIQMKAHQH